MISGAERGVQSAGRSKAHGAILDCGVAVRVKQHIGVSLAVLHISRICDPLRVEALFDVNTPLRFEGLRGLDLGCET